MNPQNSRFKSPLIENVSKPIKYEPKEVSFESVAIGARLADVGNKSFQKFNSTFGKR